MLTDAILKRMKSNEKKGKVADRDGMYAIVNKGGTVTFRYDYRFNGRRETLTLGKYGPDGLSLAEARELCNAARKKVSNGVSPSLEKAREKKEHREEDRFETVADRYFKTARMADSTRSMRHSIYDRDIGPAWKKKLLTELTADDLRSLCMSIKARGAGSTALLVRDIVKQIFNFEKLHGRRIFNIAEDVSPASIEILQPRDRFLSPDEIRIAFDLIQYVATYPTLRLGLKFILLTMVRKSELIDATWDEVNFETAVWTIPKERMKRARAHNVYLSQQSLDILIALKACSGNSPYLLPSRYEADKPCSRATFNRITSRIGELAEEQELPLEPFTVHDLRRTGSTLLNELGFNRDWIEKSIAHENRSTSRGVYNKAEYEKQRRHMLQEWATYVDAVIAGEGYDVTLFPPDMRLFAG